MPNNIYKIMNDEEMEANKQKSIEATLNLIRTLLNQKGLMEVACISGKRVVKAVDLMTKRIG